jgi:hypothetical protein
MNTGVGREGISIPSWKGSSEDVEGIRLST